MQGSAPGTARPASEGTASRCLRLRGAGEALRRSPHARQGRAAPASPRPLPPLPGTGWGRPRTLRSPRCRHCSTWQCRPTSSSAISSAARAGATARGACWERARQGRSLQRGRGQGRKRPGGGECARSWVPSYAREARVGLSLSTEVLSPGSEGRGSAAVWKMQRDRDRHDPRDPRSAWLRCLRESSEREDAGPAVPASSCTCVTPLHSAK